MRITKSVVVDTFNQFKADARLGDEFFLKYRSDNPMTLTVIARGSAHGGYTTPFGETYRTNAEMYSFLLGLIMGYQMGQL